MPNKVGEGTKVGVELNSNQDSKRQLFLPLGKRNERSAAALEQPKGNSPNDPVNRGRVSNQP